MRFFLSLALILLSFSSCSRHIDRDDLVVCENIRHANNERLEHEGFYTINAGYSYPSTICTIKGSYGTKNHRFSTLKEAHDFFHHFVKEYLKPFNDDQYIRPYLHNYPLTADNLELTILFLDSDGGIMPRPSIASIRLIKGNVYYDIYDRSSKTYSPVRKEPFTPSPQ
ncbi:MAG: hypothetical protein JSR37_05600 [Verrucomicrobia bacterium]|nr:hypothetical protein [Verrucomicrobiota bacterium]MBS0636354.1 hypothetical protein [Verrucomicrobiota bacterium]